VRYVYAICGSHDTSIIIMWHALRLKIDLTGAMELERRLEERISEFQLPNGLHFIIMERHNAPIVSVHTYANVGAFDERHGQTGAPAHLYHPVFQEGTRSDISC
jgi:predicted Zn-dependent peptidase